MDDLSLIVCQRLGALMQLHALVDENGGDSLPRRCALFNATEAQSPKRVHVPVGTHREAELPEQLADV